MVTLGSFSCVSSQSHWWRCSACIPDGPPEQFRRRHLTASKISSSLGFSLSLGRGWPTRAWAFPAGGSGGRVPPSIPSSDQWLPFLEGNGGWGVSTAYFYHTYIYIHTSLTRCGSDARRGSMASPSTAALHWLLPCTLTLILHPSLRTDLYTRYCPAVIISSTKRQVSGEIHAWRTRSLQGGLGTAPRISAKRRSSAFTFRGDQRGTRRLLPR